MSENTEMAARAARTIEGIVALCLSSADRIVWVDHSDAVAFSDGEHLFLPRPSTQNPHEYELLLALALREVSKIQKGDASAFGAAQAAAVPFAAPIEEVRLKVQLSKDYRGAPSIFGNAVAIASELFAAAAQRGELENERLQSVLTWSVAHCGAFDTDAARVARDLIREAVEQERSPESVRQAMSLALTAATSGSTRESVEIGSHIWRLFQVVQEDPPPESSDGDGNQDGLESTADDADQRSTSQGSAGQPTTAEVEPSVDQPLQSPAATGIDDASSPAPNERGGADPMSDALARMHGHEQSIDRSTQAGEFLATAAMTGTEHVDLAALQAALQDPGVTPAELQDAACGALMDEAQDLTGWLGGDEYASDRQHADRLLLDTISARLVTVMMRALQDVRRRPFLRTVAGPRVSARHAWRLGKMKDTRVFTRKAPAAGIDAAIGILLDKSISMEEDGRFDRAVAVVHAFLIGLRRIAGVQTALDVYPGSHASSESVLSFKHAVAAAVERLRRMKPSGGTPTGEALSAMLHSLIATRCERKFLLDVTDGKPSPSQWTMAQAVIEQAKALGVTVIGIGIGVDVSALYPISVTVEHAQALPDALARLFKDELVERLAA